MIYRVPSFLAFVWFGSLLTHYTPTPRQQVVSLSQSSCVSPGELTDLGGRGGRGARSYVLPTLNQSILSGSKEGKVIWFLATLNKGYSSAMAFWSELLVNSLVLLTHILPSPFTPGCESLGFKLLASVLKFGLFQPNVYTQCSIKYVNIKSTKVYVPSSELGLSKPLSRQRVCPSPQNRGGGHTCQGVRGWWSLNSDDWRKSLALCLLCAVQYRRRLQREQMRDVPYPPFFPITKEVYTVKKG